MLQGRGLEGWGLGLADSLKTARFGNSQILGPKEPKGPSRTKNATTIAKIVELLRRSVFTTPPQIYYEADPSRRGKMSVIPRKMVSAQGAPR